MSNSTSLSAAHRHHLQRVSVEDRILFACMRKELHDQHLVELRALCAEDVDWEQVYTIAEQHGVAPLAFASLQLCDGVSDNLPSSVRSRFEEDTLHSKLRKGLAERRIKEILRFFNSRSIDVMLLKGAAHDRILYSQPWETTSADVDLMINFDRHQLSEADRGLATELLGRTGSELQQLVTVEPGWREHHDVSMNGILPVDFLDIWTRAVALEVDGEPAAVMCPEDLLLAACISSCRRRYFRLKLLYEIAEITRTWELAWSEIIDRAKAWKCTSIVYAALVATELSVGCRVPRQTLDRLRVGPVQRCLIDQLSRRMSFSSLTRLHTGTNVLGRHVNCSIMLPYVTYGWRQSLRHMSVAWRTS